ncbi:BPS1 protein [Trifolium repens]|nr:BPS1 protein [Trifolium repens]
MRRWIRGVCLRWRWCGDFGGRGESERFWVETVEFEGEGKIITLLLQTSLQLLILIFTSPHKSLARLLELYQGVEEKLLD